MQQIALKVRVGSMFFKNDFVVGVFASPMRFAFVKQPDFPVGIPAGVAYLRPAKVGQPAERVGIILRVDYYFLNRLPQLIR